MTDRYGNALTLPGAKRDTMLSYPRSPSPAARSPLMEDEQGLKARADVAAEEGAGWEISFDEDDLESVVSCIDGKDDGLGGAGVQDNENSVMALLEPDSLPPDWTDSTGSSGGSGASIHTPSTVHTAIISILPPTTASTANFPLDIFPSPPKLYTELGPLEKSTQNQSQNQLAHGPRHCSNCQRLKTKHRRYSDPHRTRQPVAFERSTIPFAPFFSASSGSRPNGIAQEPKMMTGYLQQRRRSSIHSGFGAGLKDRSGGCKQVSCGEGTTRLELIGNEISQEERAKKLKAWIGKEGDARTCMLFDQSCLGGQALDQKEAINIDIPSAPSSSSPRQQQQQQQEQDDALWPSLPSGPSSPNFTSVTRQPLGRVLSGFSDFSYTSCSFAIDSHAHEHQELGVVVDCSPTVPIFPPSIGSDHERHHNHAQPATPSRPPRSRPPPLSLSSTLASVFDDTPGATPTIDTKEHLASEDKGATLDVLESSITTKSTTGVSPLINTKRESESSSPPRITAGGSNDNQHPTPSREQQRQPLCPRPQSDTRSSSSTVTPARHLNLHLPLEGIDNPPSNDNQLPLVVDKNIGEIEDTRRPSGSSTTIDDTTAQTLASPISIYSAHTGPSLSPNSQDSATASMPLSVGRLQQDWDQDTHHSFNPSSTSYQPHSAHKTPSGAFTRNGFTPRSENIVTPPDSVFISPPPSYSHHTGNLVSRRISKISASSNSSYSSDASSLRHEKGLYHTAEKPDIPTVFEEDPALDVELQESQRTDTYSKDLSSRRGTGGNGGIAGSSNIHTRHHQSTISQSSSTPSFSIHQIGHTQPLARHNTRPRQGTVSSINSAGAKSTKSVHPFASSATREPLPTAPPLPPTTKLLAPEVGRGGLPASRSSPNLVERYKAESSAMHQPHQVTLVSEEDARDDEETCPVCCESLSFTYRLPGEKPHIVPECGHSLHEECFVVVYGEMPSELSKRKLGVCGVCRQEMRPGDGGEKRKGGNKSKLAMLMGQNNNDGRPSNQDVPAPSIRSFSGRSTLSAHPTDPHGDDPLESAMGMNASNSSRSLATDGMSSTPKVLIPFITVKSEYSSIARSRKNGKQLLTAMVTVQVPSAGDRGKYSARSRAGYSSHLPTEDMMHSPLLPPSPMSTTSPRLDYPQPRSASGATNPAATPDPFAHVLADLKNRVVNYKDSGLDQIGRLRLFDLLAVRKGALVREFHVYLYQDALVCIAEEKKSGFRNMFSSSTSTKSGDSGPASAGRGVMKLKGRIYVKHVQKILDTSVQGELSLTIKMVDESMDSFILTFRDRGSHETWKSNLNRLIEETKGQAPLTGNSAAKIARMMGNGVPLPKSATPKGYTPTSSTSHQGQSAVGMSSFGDIGSPSTIHSFDTPATSGFSHNNKDGYLAFAQPLAPVHTPIDLVICLSLPSPPGASGGNLPLKVRLMRQSLAFILALMGPRDRIALVACEMGQAGIVRKTPLLNTTRPDSRRRLEAFVESLGGPKIADDEFEVAVGPNERQDVVTAVNVGLDVVLQRKAKNALTGMILLSDTSDVIKRAQMELVTARLDAANVPVHCLGYGKSHDPSPLWMLSNHTHGTYTFVKEWYDLRDTLAGVVGGLMSIALTNMKLHLNAAENEFRITRVSGTVQAIVSQDGKDVDIELRELRHGETREILVEMELGNGNGSTGEGEQQYSSGTSEEEGSGLPVPGGHSIRSGSNRGAPSFSSRGTGANGLGLDMLSINESSAREGGYEDGSIDEVPVTEVDCSYTDPAAGRSVARLAHPVLLTIALLSANSPPSSRQPDPGLVRRRMELLTSDMITRALLIASRKNFSHAARILRETKKIIETMSDGMRASLHSSGHARSKREVQVILAVEGLGNALGDVDMLLDGLEEHKELFERDHRNYAAQQAIVLKSQKSWTARTPSERWYCTEEVQRIIQLSGEYSARQ